jgi:hypothetical protein
LDDYQDSHFDTFPKDSQDHKNQKRNTQSQNDLRPGNK